MTNQSTTESTAVHPSLQKNPIKSIGHSKAVVILLIGTLFLAGTPLWVKAANMDPATQAFLRVALGALILLPLALNEMKKKMSLPKQGIIYSVVAGIFLGIDFTAWNFSIFLIGSGVAAILLNLQVVIVPILSTIFDKYRLPKSFIVILPLMIIGVLLTGGVFESTEAMPGPDQISGIRTSVLGTVFGLASGICYSFYLYFSRKAGTTAPRKDLYVQPMFYTMIAQTVAPIIAMIFGNGFAISKGVLTEDPETGQMVLPEMPENVNIFDAVQMGDDINTGNWINLIVLIVVGQAAAWTLVQIGSVWLEPVLSAGILLLSPVTSVIVAWPLFGEIPSLLQWLGILIILGCVAYQNGLFDVVFKRGRGADTASPDTRVDENKIGEGSTAGGAPGDQR